MKSSKSSRSKKPPVRKQTSQQQAASGAGGQYGEGNYDATRKYNKGVKEHMKEHDVEKEARDAAPRNASEESDMLAAEREGRSRARGEESPGEDVGGNEDFK